MNSIDILRNEYPGDQAWQAFVDVFRPAWKLRQDGDLYRLNIGDEEIAIVLTALMGARASDWFVNPCAALGRRAPCDVLRNEHSGLKVIRSFLMRMH